MKFKKLMVPVVAAVMTVSALALPASANYTPAQTSQQYTVARHGGHRGGCGYGYGGGYNSYCGTYNCGIYGQHSHNYGGHCGRGW